MSDNYPQLKPRVSNKGKREPLVRDASAFIHDFTQSTGAGHASEYSTLVPQLHEAPEPYQDAESSDHAKRTPRAAAEFFSVLNLIPRTWVGALPEDLVEPAPSEEYVSQRNLDKRKSAPRVED